MLLGLMAAHPAQKIREVLQVGYAELRRRSLRVAAVAARQS